MGMTPRRIGFGVLSAIAVVLAIRKPTVAVPAKTAATLESREREAALRLASARLHWSALEQRDGVLASNRPALITMSGFTEGSGFAEKDSAYVLDLIQRARHDLSVLVRVHFYEPTSYGRNRWGVYSGTLITPGEPTTCTAILPVDPLPGGRIVIGRQGLISVLSPCLLLGTFGVPGRMIGNWLNALRYAPARSGHWLIGSTMEDWDSGPWAWLRDASLGDPTAPQGFALSRLLGLEQEALLLTPPYYYGQLGVQCLSGMKRSCAKAVLDPGIVAQETEGLPRDLTLFPFLIRSPRISLLTPRPPGPTFLSDLIQDKGRDRFLRFWKSEAPVEMAFEDAFHETLADWTSRWAGNRWLTMWDARYRSAEVLLGVTLRLSWIPLALAWSLLAIGVAGWAARRRQVTA